MRVIVVGWDGATWELLDRLCDAGRLPNLAALKRESVRGPLASVHPPVTAPAWVTLATGVNPGRHGCFDFNRPEGSLGSLRPLQTWDIGAKTFYEVLAERGRRCVLINLPVTHPPLTEQPTVTSLLTQGDNAVFPESLKETHPSLTDYRIFPDTSLRISAGIRDYLRDIRAVEAARFEAVKALWQESWDLFFVVFSGSDWVSHEAFPQLMEGRYDAVPDALGVFEDLDRYLGWILEQRGDDDALLMVSDHGFRTGKGVFYLNEWLAREGYLTPDFSKPALPSSHRMEEAAQKAFLQGKMPSAKALKGVYENPSSRFWVKVRLKLGGRWPWTLMPDPVLSRALAPTAECLGVVIHDAERWPDGTVPQKKMKGLREELREKLRSLSDPLDGEAVFTSADPREAVYSGAFVEDAPHLVLGAGAWGVSAAIRDLPGELFDRRPLGLHAPEGLFLGIGPGLQSNMSIDSLSLQDIAPLLYHLLGEAIPEGLDGELKSGLFPTGALEAHPPRYAPVEPPVRTRRDMESEEIQDRLKGLGYMG